MSTILNAVKRTLNKAESAESVNEIPKSALSPILNKKNAGIEEAVSTLSELMHFGEKENTRLNASSKILELHGVSRDDKPEDNRILIVVQNDTEQLVAEDDVELNKMLNPQRIIDVEPEKVEAIGD